MNIDWVGLETEFRAIGEDRLDLVEEDESRPLHGKLRDGHTKQLRDCLLGFPMRRAGERVGLHFGIAQTLAIETVGRARRQSPRQRSFSGSGLSRKENDSVQWHDGAVNFRAQSKVKDGLAEQRVLDLLVDDDCFPEGREFF